MPGGTLVRFKLEDIEAIEQRNGGGMNDPNDPLSGCERAMEVLGEYGRQISARKVSPAAKWPARRDVPTPALKPGESAELALERARDVWVRFESLMDRAEGVVAVAIEEQLTDALARDPALDCYQVPKFVERWRETIRKIQLLDARDEREAEDAALSDARRAVEAYGAK